MTAPIPDIIAVPITELELPFGHCTVCGHKGWAILVILSTTDEVAFYLCDTHRRDLIDKLCSV